MALSTRSRNAACISLGILLACGGLVRADLPAYTPKPDSWRSGLSADGPAGNDVVWDTAFAGWIKEADAGATELFEEWDATISLTWSFTFTQCYGGGFLTELENIQPAPPPFGANSASKYFQPTSAHMARNRSFYAHAWQNRAKAGAPPVNHTDKTITENAWTALQDGIGGGAPPIPDNTRVSAEETQYTTSALPELLAAGSLANYAILFVGEPESRHLTNINAIYSVLSDDYSFVSEDIYILYGDGETPDGADGWTADVAATPANLQNALAAPDGWLSDSLLWYLGKHEWPVGTMQVFFWASDHGTVDAPITFSVDPESAGEVGTGVAAKAALGEQEQWVYQGGEETNSVGWMLGTPGQAVDAISFGTDPVPNIDAAAKPGLYFSVDRLTVGAGGVNRERARDDNSSPAPDVFTITSMSNRITINGEDTLGLLELLDDDPSHTDDLNALSYVPIGGHIVPGPTLLVPVFFSIAGSSIIYVYDPLAPPGAPNPYPFMIPGVLPPVPIVLDAAAGHVLADFDIDALALNVSFSRRPGGHPQAGRLFFNPAADDRMIISVAPNGGAEHPGDIWRIVGRPPLAMNVFKDYLFNQIGLVLPADNVDALDVYDGNGPGTQPHYPSEAEIKWKDPLTGFFQDTAKWVNDVVPGVGDVATFDVIELLAPGVSYTVDFDVGPVNRRLLVEAAKVTFDLGGHTYELTGAGSPASLVVAKSFQAEEENAPHLVITDGRLEGVKGVIGDESGSKGTVTVEGPDAVWESSDLVQIGDRGEGTLIITSTGDVLSGSATIGAGSGSRGTVTVEDFSFWGVTEGITVGGSGATSAAMQIKNGSLVMSDRGIVTGEVIIQDFGSTWDVTETLSVNGLLAGGSIEITAAGELQSKNGTLGLLGTDTGTVTVRDAGSRWIIAETLTVGGSGEGTVNIEDGGLLESARGWLGALTNGSSGTVNIVGAGSLWECAGDIDIGGTTGPAGQLAGELRVEAGGKVIAKQDGALKQIKVQLRGQLSGRASVQAKVVNAGGKIDPGDSPGHLTIEGSYRQEPNGTLSIELGGLVPGDEYDVLEIIPFSADPGEDGRAQLGGTLSVSFIDGFEPNSTDNFSVLLSSGLSGSFDNELVDGKMFTADGAWVFTSNYGLGPDCLDCIVLTDFIPTIYGACCVEDGTCVYLTADACATLAGVYGGVGSICVDQAPPADLLVDPFDGPCLLWNLELADVADFTAQFVDGEGGNRLYEITEIVPGNDPTISPLLQFSRLIDAPDNYEAQLAVEWSQDSGQDSMVATLGLFDANGFVIAWVALLDSSLSVGPHAAAAVIPFPQVVGQTFGLDGAATLRLEVVECGPYEWRISAFVNGQLLASGATTREAAQIQIHVRRSSGGSFGTVSLDQLTFGAFPPPPSCPGDMNGDGRRDGADAQGFVDCMVGAGAGCCLADIDGDEVLDDADASQFVELLLYGTECP